MNEFLKKTLLICGIFVLSVFTSLTVFADEGRCGARAFWTFENGTLTISGTGAITQYERDVATDSVNSPWWDFREDITKVVVEDGIQEFHNYSFYRLENMEEVSLPSSLTTMDARVFYKCSSLEEITIPKNVKMIGMECFVRSGLKKITFLGNCPRVSPSAPFEGIIADVTCNGDPAFYTTNFGGAFTFHVTERRAAEDNEPDPAAEVEMDTPTASGTCGKAVNWAYSDGLLLITGEGDMLDFTRDETTDATDAPWEDFKADIKRVVIGKGVTSIGKYAFYNCTNLKDVTVSSTVLDVKFAAFKKCSSLKEILLPKGISSIGSQAFAESGLKRLNFKGTVPSDLGSYMVENDPSVTVAYLCREVAIDESLMEPFGDKVTWDRWHDAYEGKCMYCGIKVETVEEESETEAAEIENTSTNTVKPGIIVVIAAVMVAAIVIIAISIKKKKSKKKEETR